VTQDIYCAVDGNDSSSVEIADSGPAAERIGECGCELETHARPATLLGLELLLQEPVVDLGSVVSLLVADVAATVRVAQLAAREVSPDSKAPVRLAECIANLDLNRLLRELSE
jgi:hypothetical protein